LKMCASTCVHIFAVFCLGTKTLHIIQFTHDLLCMIGLFVINVVWWTHNTLYQPLVQNLQNMRYLPPRQQHRSGLLQLLESVETYSQCYSQWWGSLSQERQTLHRSESGVRKIGSWDL
jgi:hypothetical protein